MRMTAQERIYYGLYERADDAHKLVIVQATGATMRAIHAAGFAISALDDERAQALHAAIMKYLIACNPAQPKQ